MAKRAQCTWTLESKKIKHKTQAKLQVSVRHQQIHKHTAKSHNTTVEVAENNGQRSVSRRHSDVRDWDVLFVAIKPGRDIPH